MSDELSPEALAAVKDLRRARMLTKHAKERLLLELPERVTAQLRENQAQEQRDICVGIQVYYMDAVKLLADPLNYE